MPQIDAIAPRVRAAGQEHLLLGVESLDPAARAAFARQLEAIDWDALPGWIKRYVRAPETPPTPDALEPAPYYPQSSERKPAWDRDRYRGVGEELLRAGKVACFTVAGGQGSRLGYDGPKGCYPAGCVTGKPLFEVFADGVRATAARYGAPVPWYIMTSPLNHEATVGFFATHEHFGLDPNDVKFFPQGTIPSLDKATGRVLLSEPGEVATNPDGHGGAIRALYESGAVKDMRARGIEHVSYFQVDNPHTRVADPVFLGLHAAAPDSSGEFSSKMVAKAAWDEKVGVFCKGDGRVCVIEYSDLPESLAKETDAGGSLRFNAGSVAIHAIGVGFIEKLATDAASGLPFHRAVKKVPCYDPELGEQVDPTEPNGVKLERFIFDAIPLAGSSIVYETDRVEEFAPIKNASGADSVETSKDLQTERAARWLEAAGVSVPRGAGGRVDAVIEISGLTALDAAHLRERSNLPSAIEPGAKVVL
ncbi:MAG: UDP-N-acetylhexosamine pyrophosphorylase [Phycisphaeraceae bacterium]|nr:MAG: UDP-N-acetylhexosamine pyrophosphorylase [Phycisphaeraceae bacterium]